MDGLNWDLLNDGPSTPRNTKSLLWVHRTPPAMSLGVRATAEAAVRAGLRHVQFAVRPEADAAALDAYLKSLEPLPSPQWEDQGFDVRARRGKRLYEQAGCVNCHAPPLYTSGKSYDVGTGTTAGGRPSLRYSRAGRALAHRPLSPRRPGDHAEGSADPIQPRRPPWRHLPPDRGGIG